MKLATFVGVLVLLGVVEFSSAKLDCNKVQLKPRKQALEGACKMIKEGGVDESNKSELVNECLCNLASHAELWRPMVDSKVQKLYAMVVAYNPRKSSGKCTSSCPTETVESWLSRYESEFGGNSGAMAAAFQREAFFKFSQYYGDVAEPEAEAKGREYLKDSCGQLLESFAPYWPYFEAAANVARDQVHAALARDHNLIAATLAYRTCSLPNLW